MAVSNDHEESDALPNLPDTSDPRVKKLLDYLLQGKDYSECAHLLRVSVRTVLELRKRHALDEYIARLNMDAMQAAATGYVATTKLVFQRLHGMLKSKNKDDHRFAIEQYARLAKTGGDRLPQRGEHSGPPAPPPHQPARALTSAELVERARGVQLTRRGQR